ncbi:MAG: hypothetical protein QW273_02455, partial [Candidatus Pacearchaeota archaeon]
MTGFHKEIKSRLATIYPHIIVTSQMFISETIFAQNKNVVSYSPFIYSQAILKYGDKVYSAVVKGISYNTEIKVVHIDKIIKWSTDKISSRNSKFIILGKEMAKNLGVGFNDEIVMILPTTVITPFGNLPLTEKFIVKGILSSGIYEYDNNLCIIDYELATKLFFDKSNRKLEGVTGFGIKLKNENMLEQTIIELKNQLGPFTKVVSWVELNSNLFTALKLEKIMMIIVVSLII